MTSTFRGAGIPGAALLLTLLSTTPAFAQEAATPTYSMQQLVRMPRGELEALYLSSPAASVPQGFAPGRAIKNPGSRRTERNSRATGLVWKGKIFREGTMVNRFAGGLTAIPAEVYVGES